MHMPTNPAFITTLDMKSAYMAVEGAEADRCKTAFATPMGLFQFKRMPFGLKGAPMSMSRVGMAVLKDVVYSEGYLFYDDITVVTGADDDTNRRSAWSRHCRAVRRVLRRCVKHGLKLHRGKCKFAVKQADWVDRNISEEGLRKRDDGALQSLNNFPVPTTKRELQRFLGLAGYYRAFVENYAGVVEPLRALLPKGAGFSWGNEQQRAFEQVIAAINTDAVLKIPDWGKPFVLETDASDIAVGATLNQEDADGRLRPVKILSRSLSSTERKYSATERELLALVWSIQRLRPYLAHVPFRAVVGYNNLRCAVVVQATTHRTHRTLGPVVDGVQLRDRAQGGSQARRARRVVAR